MPRIKINETELTTFATFDATENTVLVPLFVSMKGKQPKRYTSLGDFKVDFPVGEIREAEIEDSQGVYRVTVSGGQVAYWKEEIPAKDSKVKEIVKFDKSYLMICELLNAGLPVVVKPFYVEGGEFENEDAIVEALNLKIIGSASSSDPNSINGYSEFRDKNLWNIKFITSGAYNNVRSVSSTNPGDGGTGDFDVTGAYSVMRRVAENRGDCISLVEFEKGLPYNSEYVEESSEEVITLVNILEKLSNSTGSINEAAFYPWGIYSTPAAGLSNQMTADMPACFGYLLAVANNSLTNANWFANSGTIRGRVPNLNSLLCDIGESAMHYLQHDNEDDVSSTGNQFLVNPIMPVGVYGIRIWGNRTTKYSELDSYNQFLNVRILVCDIKKQLYHSSLRITFEPNDDIAWINFKKLNNTLLDRMQSGRGIQWYRWSKLITDAKATLKALLTIKPIEALEYFDITISLAEDGSAVVEEVI